MRLPRLIGLVAGCMVAILAAPLDAKAQLFSSKWSGFGGGSVQARPLPMPRTFSLRSFGRFNPYNSRSEVYDGEGDGSWNGSYRTLCVRLCDGYYFPVSYRTTRGRMHRDAKICETSCDCETKLFYLPSSSSDIKSATDFSGQSYGRLENAFAYRQAWDLGCSCRPAPWSSAEKLRHDEYAVVWSERQAELQSRKGEALAGLIAREDAKDAEAAADLLADVSGQGRRPAAVIKSRRLASSMTVEAEQPAPMAPAADVDRPYERVAGDLGAAGQVALAEPEIAELDPQQAAAEETIPVPRQNLTAPKKPTVARPAKSASTRSQKSASGQGKPSRPGSRGFFQM